MAIGWCDGKWLEAEEIPRSLTDRGLVLGLSLFETILGIDGEPKFVGDHLKRLAESYGRLGWQLSTAGLKSAMTELLVRNDLAAGRARIRLTTTAGSGAFNDLSRGGDAVSWITAVRADEPPEQMAVTISPWKRNEHSPVAGLKCGSYAENIFALDAARKAGFEEAIFFNTAGRLCEAATSNIFIVRNARILTPPLDSGCLPGITRGVVIGLAEKHGLICKETPLEKADLENADEIFLTSAIRGPVAVSRLDGRAFRSSPVAASVREWWKEEICGG
jgi:branched-subunit amino acid aminotransferase/4-amino-4-deoxychorismate lyase